MRQTSLNDGSPLGNNRSGKAPLLAFSEPQGEPSFRKKLSQRIELRKALMIAVVLLVNQQFSGINSVFFYSSSLFASANVNPWLGKCVSTQVIFVKTLSLRNLLSVHRKCLWRRDGVVFSRKNGEKSMSSRFWVYYDRGIGISLHQNFLR